MRRIFIMLSLLAFAVASPAQRVMVDNATVSVTDANSVVPFTDDGSGGTGQNFSATEVLVRSSSASANTCYFDFNDTTATTADVVVEAGASVKITAPEGHDGFPGIGAICSGGETATFYVTATR